MVGSALLPTSIYKGRLYFLFGKERDIDDTPGWSDFGGGIDKGETPLSTAIRESQEELTGFLGGDKSIRQLMKRGTYKINHQDNYHVFICRLEYDDKLPYYYNNNSRFLQKRLDPKVIRDTKIFEKAEIRWVCVDDLKKMRPEFRSFYQEIVDVLIEQKDDIFQFIKKRSSKTLKKKH
jgi:8-oxo-dGTP pyrophosphatase MutT (NUDIX family)